MDSKTLNLNNSETRKNTKTTNRAYQGMSAPSRVIKRTTDIIMSLVAIAVFALPCVVIAWFIWNEDHHSPIYSQERIGRGGKPFMLYKFRSMRIDAESNGSPQLCQGHDSRLTRVGAFIRAHHLDEFPQLWNVLCGDMSFVGYRPERRYFIEKIMAINPDYQLLYATRPGIFSYATLHNGYTDSMEKMLTRLEMDLKYLENQSLWGDMKIIFDTAYAIISGKKI